MNQQRLTAVLAEFARTLLTDYSVEAILEHLVLRVAEVVSVSGAGVVLLEGSRPHFVAATDSVLPQVETLQDLYDEGPCLEACRTGQPVLVPDLTRDERFPRFAPAAVAAGLGAVFTFPLRCEGRLLGALDLYCSDPRELTGAEFGAAQLLADVSAAYVANARSRVEAHATATEMERRSLHDPLTGLANRALLLDRLTRALLLAKRSQTSAGVLFVDLDDFKRVNDHHGHHVGDELLVAVAGRMQGVLRPGDTLARLGGDEFVIVCEGLSGAGELDGVVARVVAAFSRPFRIAGHDLDVRSSIGTAVGGAADEAPHQLLEAADRSMYLHKGPGPHSGTGRGVRGPGPRGRRPLLEHELGEVIADGSLRLAYQPVVDLATDTWLGVEALVRWPRRLGGDDVGAADIVAAAERAGLMVPLGAWVLARACADVRSWQDVPGAPTGVSVNVSTTQLAHAAFADIVQDVLQRSGTAPGDLCLEIARPRAVEEVPAQALRTVGRLREAGVRIAVDGFLDRRSAFGPGARIPPDVVKIGRPYVGDLGREPVGEAVVTSILSHCARIDVRVIAEGIETTGQLRRLRDLGCLEGQGYLLGPPRSLEELRRDLVSVGDPAPGG
ncbi:hypothetical protein NUM3379_38020 [Kineococcus sp. NUM-3379]